MPSTPKTHPPQRGTTSGERQGETTFDLLGLSETSTSSSKPVSANITQNSTLTTTTPDDPFADPFGLVEAHAPPSNHHAESRSSGAPHGAIQTSEGMREGKDLGGMGVEKDIFPSFSGKSMSHPVSEKGGDDLFKPIKLKSSGSLGSGALVRLSHKSHDKKGNEKHRYEEFFFFFFFFLSLSDFSCFFLFSFLFLPFSFRPFGSS